LAEDKGKDLYVLHENMSEDIEIASISQQSIITSACVNFHLDRRFQGFSIMEPQLAHFLSRVDVYTQFSTFSYEEISEISPHETNCMKE
jgi:hypothetical protein